MWGTDAIWYGSPEPQIMAMRTFEITPRVPGDLQYPALTAEVKAGLFGLNAANLFGVDPTATRCGLTARSADRQHLRDGLPPRRGRAALRLAAARPDDAPPGPGLAGLVRHPLGAVVAPGGRSF